MVNSGVTMAATPQTFVCINCRIRKKKCDKATPSCSYCVQ